MNRCIFSVSILLTALATSSADEKSLLVAPKPWTIVKSEDAPAGTTFKFDPDGAFHLAMSLDGKKRNISGTYSVAGSTLTIKLSHDGRDRVDVRTIRKLTPTTLILEDKNRKIEEFMRKE